jgi:hypothetical protein
VLAFAVDLAVSVILCPYDRARSYSSSHLVTKRYYAALIGFNLCKMEGDISVELVEEAEPITDQDWQDRITNFVGQAEAKAFARNGTTSDKPNAAKRRAQTSIDELRKIA